MANTSNSASSSAKRSIVISERDNIAVLMEGDKALEFIINRADMLLGDVYLAEVENILPSIDAAFVNVGGDKMGFLHSSDVEGKGDLKTRLKPKQKIIVQVMKEPTGHKGPRVTTNLSLPGRFLVLIPESKGISISRKIESATERARLKSIVNLSKPAGVGVIIRTEAQGQGDSDLQEDFEVLLERWQNIVSMADSSKPPTMLYRDQDLLYRVIREMVTEEVVELTVDTSFGAQRAQQLLQNWNLDKSIRVTHYTGTQSIMTAKGVEREIRQALQTKVPLPSGGYLYVQQTEALTVVDVNSGKFTSLQSQSDTIRITNLESTKEIARQLRLRNIGGMVIVDFIDMEARADQLAVLQAFEQELLPDKAKPQVGQLTDLGLVEMTRHRQGQSLKEIFAKTCPTCNGVGHVADEFAWATLGMEQRAAQDARHSGPGGRRSSSLRTRFAKSEEGSGSSHSEGRSGEGRDKPEGRGERDRDRGERSSRFEGRNREGGREHSRDGARGEGRESGRSESPSVIRSVGLKPARLSDAETEFNDEATQQSRGGRDRYERSDDRHGDEGNGSSRSGRGERGGDRDRDRDRDKDRDRGERYRDRGGRNDRDDRYRHEDEEEAPVDPTEALKVLMPAEKVKRPAIVSLLDPPAEMPEWLRYYNGQPLTAFYQGLLLQTTGLQLAGSVKVALTPHVANGVLSRMNPRATDVFRLVESMESLDEDDTNDEGDDDDDAAETGSREKVKAFAEEARHEEPDHNEQEEHVSSKEDDEENDSFEAPRLRTTAPRSRTPQVEEDDDDEENNNASSSFEEPEDGDELAEQEEALLVSPVLGVKVKTASGVRKPRSIPAKTALAFDEDALEDDEEDSLFEDDDTTNNDEEEDYTSLGTSGKEPAKVLRRKRPQPKQLARKVSKVSTRPKLVSEET